MHVGAVFIAFAIGAYVSNIVLYQTFKAFGGAFLYAASGFAVILARLSMVVGAMIYMIEIAPNAWGLGVPSSWVMTVPWFFGLLPSALWLLISLTQLVMIAADVLADWYGPEANTRAQHG